MFIYYNQIINLISTKYLYSYIFQYRFFLWLYFFLQLQSFTLLQTESSRNVLIPIMIPGVYCNVNLVQYFQSLSSSLTLSQYLTSGFFVVVVVGCSLAKSAPLRFPVSFAILTSFWTSSSVISYFGCSSPPSYLLSGSVQIGSL